MNQIFWAVFLLTVFASSFSCADDSQASSSSTEMQPKEWQVDGSVTYETGDFGTNTTTNSTYIPLTLKRYFPEGDVAWTIPFIYQESGPGVTAIGGRPFRTSSFSGGAKRSESGLGDMLLKGRYYLLEESNDDLNLSPIAQIKFPTADEDKGLGTGEFDETIGLESSKSLNDQWLVFLDLYYTFIGDPPNNELDNEFHVAIGPGYHLSNQTMVSLIYEERTALVDGNTNPRDLILGVNHQLDNVTGAQGALSVGLSNGSPDVGITLGLNRQF